jgi:hypothetical protein
MSEESVKNEMGSLEDVIGMMDRVNEVFSYEVWVPSLNRNVMFREINTSQQKRLIKAIIDSPVYNTEFIFTLRKIIKENCVDDSVNVDQLTILDKLVIAMKMRSASISDVLEMQVPVGKGKTKRTIQRGVSLETLLETLKDKVVVPDIETFSDDKGVYQLECGIPTILNEYKLEDEMRKNSETRDIKNYDELRQTVGDVFIGEIAKYVRGLSIKEKDKITKIDLNGLSFRNRITLIEKLPEQITQKVVKYIDNVKKELDKVTLVSVNIGTDEKPEMKEEKFTLDGNFFTSS